MRKVYFVRHAEPDFSNHNDLLRELTPKGWADRQKVTEFLCDKNIHLVVSSPYKRSVDTIGDFAEKYDHDIEMIEDFRERKIGNEWIDDFDAYAIRQWQDFDYRLQDGESLKEVQKRNIEALKKLLNDHPGKNIAVGSHGTALSTIINYYDPSFSYDDFEKIKNVMPLIVEFTFDENDDCIAIKQYKFD